MFYINYLKETYSQIYPVSRNSEYLQIAHYPHINTFSSRLIATQTITINLPTQQHNSSLWQHTSSPWQHTSSPWQHTSSPWQHASLLWQHASLPWQQTSLP